MLQGMQQCLLSWQFMEDKKHRAEKSIMWINFSAAEKEGR